jgi:sarcosine oxidase subunit beta
VARLAGVELPVEPLRRMLVPTEPFDRVSSRSPMVVDMNTGFHYRPEGRGLLLAWNDPEETPGFKLDFDRGFIEKVLTRGVQRLPCLEEAEVNPRRAWAGLYEMTPDHHAVLGPVKEVPGFFLANGFSGHGVMQLPRHRPHHGGPDPAGQKRSDGQRSAGFRPFRLGTIAARDFGSLADL